MTKTIQEIDPHAVAERIEEGSMPTGAGTILGLLFGAMSAIMVGGGLSAVFNPNSLGFIGSTTFGGTLGGAAVSYANKKTRDNTIKSHVDSVNLKISGNNQEWEEKVLQINQQIEENTQLAEQEKNQLKELVQAAADSNAAFLEAIGRIAESFQISVSSALKRLPKNAEFQTLNAFVQRNPSFLNAYNGIIEKVGGLKQEIASFNAAKESFFEVIKSGDIALFPDSLLALKRASDLVVVEVMQINDAVKGIYGDSFNHLDGNSSPRQAFDALQKENEELKAQIALMRDQGEMVQAYTKMLDEKDGELAKSRQRGSLFFGLLRHEEETIMAAKTSASAYARHWLTELQSLLDKQKTHVSIAFIMEGQKLTGLPEHAFVYAKLVVNTRAIMQTVIESETQFPNKMGYINCPSSENIVTQASIDLKTAVSFIDGCDMLLNTAISAKLLAGNANTVRIMITQNQSDLEKMETAFKQGFYNGNQ